MSVQMPPPGGIEAAASAMAERVCAFVAEVRTRGGGAGAGTVWRPDGTIVTNHHVVPRDQAEVTLPDGRQLPAQVVARDPRNDLAVLEIAATGLTAAVAGDARRLRVGELVLAVGHPFGLRCAVTVGVVSAPLSAPAPDGGRELVRADVLLGPGNSGGPLTDARGRVVGINAMVAGGMALAVPSHVVERLLVGRPSLGVGIQDVELPPALSPAANGRAAIVVKVVEGGAAAKAGLLIGDVLVTLDGHPIGGAEALIDALDRHRGGPIRVGLLRGGVPREVVVSPTAAEPARRAA